MLNTHVGDSVQKNRFCNICQSLVKGTFFHHFKQHLLKQIHLYVLKWNYVSMFHFTMVAMTSFRSQQEVFLIQVNNTPFILSELDNQMLWRYIFVIHFKNNMENSFKRNHLQISAFSLTTFPKPLCWTIANFSFND